MGTTIPMFFPRTRRPLPSAVICGDPARMALDVTDLRSFYASSLGETARRLVGAILSRRWDAVAGLSIVGLGYATPYLDLFQGQPMRLLAMMPAEQGVVNWPAAGASASALIDDSMLPLPEFLRGSRSARACVGDSGTSPRIAGRNLARADSRRATDRGRAKPLRPLGAA